MIVRHSTAKRLEITEVPRLDPIRIYLEDYEPGRGRITISCYDAAWVGYWGAMGDRTVGAFFIASDAEYLADNLSCSATLSRAAHNRTYLIRVVEAVQQALCAAAIIDKTVLEHVHAA